MYTIESDAETTLKILSARSELLEWAMDDQTLPIVPEAAAGLLTRIFLRCWRPDCAGVGESHGHKEFGHALAASAELPPWRPGQIGFWVLDLIGIGQGHAQADAVLHPIILDRRTQWAGWAHCQTIQSPLVQEARRFLYAGICHGSSKYPLGLKMALRRSQEHQEVIRTKVEIAKEA